MQIQNPSARCSIDRRRRLIAWRENVRQLSSGVEEGVNKEDKVAVGHFSPGYAYGK